VRGQEGRGREVGDKGGGGVKGRQMTQTFYAHMNKRKKKKKEAHCTSSFLEKEQVFVTFLTCLCIYFYLLKYILLVYNVCTRGL
jgi:hypothetical protein